MKGGTVATTSSRALLAASAQLGLDASALLAAAGLTRSQVDDPEGRLPGEAVARLWQEAIRASGDPALAVRAALAVPFGAYRVIDFLAASASTVGEGIARTARYFPLINSVIEMVILEAPDEVVVELRNPRDPTGLPRPYAEFALAVTVLHCRRASGSEWPVARVELPWDPPPSVEPYERVFGATLRFRQPRIAFVLTRETWALRSEGASSGLLRTLEQHADRLLASLRSEEDVGAAVARAIMEELQGGEPSLPRVAKRLGMSVRTLQRRLRLAHTSFNDVLDRTRKHFATLYVQERGLQLTEIAFLLGFSEQSAFTRAFTRWFNESPTQYRSRTA